MISQTPPSGSTGEILVDAVLGQARARDERIAIHDLDQGVRLGYGRLARLVPAAAAGLAGRGLRPGDVVGVGDIASAGGIAAAVAVLAAGGAVLPGSPGAPLTVAVLTEHDTRILLTSPRCRTAATTLAERSRVRQVIEHGTAGASLPSAEPSAPGHRARTDGAALVAGAVPGGGRDVRGHRAVLADMRTLDAAIRLSAGDLVAIGTPVADGCALLTAALLALCRGATVCTASDLDVCRRFAETSQARLVLLDAARPRDGTDLAGIPPRPFGYELSRPADVVARHH